MKDLTWRHVAVIVAILLSITVISATGHDTSALIGVAMLVLAAIGIVAAQVTSVKEQTNGTTSKHLELIEKLSQQVAAMQPPPPVIPPDVPPTDAADPPSAQ